MGDLDRWSVQTIEDFRESGWFHIPTRMTNADADAWVESAFAQVKEFVGIPLWDGSPTSEEMLRGLLEYGVRDEPALPSVATFQVWPLPGPAVLTCRVCLVDRGSVPDFTEVDGAAVHTVVSEELGAGIQVSTKQLVEREGGHATVHSVDLIFADGEAAMVFSLEQSLPALIARAMPGLDVLKNAFRVVRPDGTRFSGHAPVNVLDENPWKLVEDAR